MIAVIILGLRGLQLLCDGIMVVFDDIRLLLRGIMVVFDDIRLLLRVTRRSCWWWWFVEDG